MTIKCDHCNVGKLRRAELRAFDFSIDAGFPVKLHRVPGLRCDHCGAETLQGKVVNTVLDILAFEVVRAPFRLGGDLARYLRGYLGLTQTELAKRMGISRITVANWERGKTPISPANDLILRGIVIGLLLKEHRAHAEELAPALHEVRKAKPRQSLPSRMIASMEERLREQHAA